MADIQPWILSAASISPDETILSSADYDLSITGVRLDVGRAILTKMKVPLPRTTSVKRGLEQVRPGAFGDTWQLGPVGWWAADGEPVYPDAAESFHDDIPDVPELARYRTHGDMSGDQWNGAVVAAIARRIFGAQN